MPLISPIVEAQLRRHWQVVVAAAVYAVFFAVNVTMFGPAAQRYERAIRRATQMGLAVDPTQPLAVTPPRVLILLAANMLPLAVADVSRESATLAASMLEELTQLTDAHGMQVLQADPGLTVQEANAVQIRAHLRLQCTFPQFVAFLDDLSRAGSLISVDRFAMMEGSGGGRILDLWATRYVLKQGAAK